MGYRQARFLLASKSLIAILLVALTVNAANLYTIIMRDGRRVEIPNEFTVTGSTLTYKAGPGIQITIQLTTIDIAATERANGQAPGSFLLEASHPKVADRPNQARSGPGRTITNRDLEVYRRTRVESELNYEKRRKELSLPSVEERRREVAAIAERTQQQLLNIRSQEQVPETYWRSRAASLRTEIAANDAQIDFVRRRLDEVPLTYSFGAFTTAVPFGTVGLPAVGFPFQRFSTPSIRPSIMGPRFGANAGFQTPRTSPRVQVNAGQFQRFRRGARFTGFPRANVLALPFQLMDYTLERSVLANQLNELLMRRAGLQAHWRELEDEARRAGAYPGWLR